MSPEATRPPLPALTSLRFFAALHVVLFHLQAFQIITGPSWFHKFSSVGYAGVSFFFVLSGFILVYTYAGRSVSLGDFWRARFARIYPAYAFSLLLFAPFYFPTVSKVEADSLWAWSAAHLKLSSVLVITLLQAWLPRAALAWNAVAWSLSVEAFFYLLFPFLLKGYAGRSRKQLFFVVAACWIFGVVLSSAYVWLKPDGISNINSDIDTAFWLNALKFNPLVRLAEFLMGMACGFLFLSTRVNGKVALPLIAAGLAGFMLVVHFSDRIPYPIIHTALPAPAFAAIVFGLALRPRGTSFLENRLLVLLGDASYSLYLLHVMMMLIFFNGANGRMEHQSVTGVMVFLVIALTISALVYRFIEQPARRKLRPTAKSRQPELESAAGA